MNSEKPIVANNKPKKVELEKGKTYFFCTCGRSKNQPYYDGSHKGTTFSPQSFEATETEAYLCQCKYSNRLPYCDGTHKQIDDSTVGHTAKVKKGEGGPVAKNTKEEPEIELIHELAKNGLKSVGGHGPITAMGVPGYQWPKWNDIQLLVAQLAKKPLAEEEHVATSLTVGPKANKPLVLDIPIIVSDMSFGALSYEAKCAMAMGAELAGTGICSGECGMLPEEQQNNSRYFYELASAMFGYDEAQLSNVQAFHFKAGQGAKTGTGGHLPACKNTGKISEVRKLEPGTWHASSITTHI